jgi:methionyl-tRNA synthetase
MVHRMNGDLANDFGNLAQRVLSFVAKNAGGIVPTPGELQNSDLWLRSGILTLKDDVKKALEQQQFHRALETIWHIISEANRYVDEQAPWALRKTDPARMATVLYVLLEVIRHLAIILQPFMPDSMAKMLDQLAVPEDARTFAHLSTQTDGFDEASLKPGTKLPKPEGVFPRYVEEAAAS